MNFEHFKHKINDFADYYSELKTLIVKLNFGRYNRRDKKLTKCKLSEMSE